ncbi:MAG: hypothetical protein GC164_00185 [Phycisphaera sp.]|nr:hypothetical protein [Phycisphaera sp.]
MSQMSLVVGLMKMNLNMVEPLLKGVPDEKLAYQSGSFTGHAAWQLGHLASSLAFAGSLCGATYTLPDGWQEKFGNGSTPTPNRADYPSAAALVAEVKKATDALAAHLPNVDEKTLTAPFPDEQFRAFWPTVGDGVVFLATTHVAYHLGILAGWRRVIGLGSAFGF